MQDVSTPGFLARLPRPPRKVALLRASRIGDFLCAVPALRALRAALPEAEITMITLPMLRELAERSPYLDRFAPFPGFPGIAEQLFEARKTLRFLQEMQAERFDLAIQMQGSGVYANPFMLLLGAERTVGFVRPGEGPGRLDAAMAYPQQGHEVRRLLALTSFLGAPPQGEGLEFPLRAEEQREAEALLSGAERPLIGLHPWAREELRRWPAERFAAAGRELRRRYGGTLVLLGDAEARTMCAAVARQVGQPCLDLTGRTSLPTLGAVIARLALLLTNDTGPAHIAYALGAPTVTISGADDPARYAPLGSGPFRVLAQPGARLDCITVQQALQAAAEVMPRSAVSLPRRS